VPREAWEELELRERVELRDVRAIRELVLATGLFSPAEVEIAAELALAGARLGDPSGYCFLLAEAPPALLGYTCYGPIDGTQSSFDLYWIAVAPKLQRRGLGRRLLEATEARVARAGGRRLYVDTSARPDYAPTRAFYERAGYVCEATLADYYSPGDAKAIYVKELQALRP
jgi:ribosomal protein S18 acetylase RimI-like enzyme